MNGTRRGVVSRRLGILAAALVASGLFAAEAAAPSLVLPDDVSGTLVVRHGEQVTIHDEARASIRLLPASTFKIPNMLIALETGVATDAEAMIPWDGKRPESGFWRSSWSQDQTLRSAFGESTIWYFQEIARRIGRERMQAWIDRFEYGNRDLDGPLDRFWLDGPLAISALEQTRFLKRFLDGSLGLSERTTRIAREILRLEETPVGSLSGKTGTAVLPDGRYLAWFVGYVERGDDLRVFALNLDCPSYEICDAAMRKSAVLAAIAKQERPAERPPAADR